MTNAKYDFISSDNLNEACREGNVDQLKLILEEVKGKGNSYEPLLNLKYRVSRRGNCIM